MFAMNNIIRSTERRDRLNIILVNLQDEDYIQKICALLDHNFFIINNFGAWNPNMDIPANLRLLPNLSSVEYFDLVISFDRAKSFDLGKHLSFTLNINHILVDLAPKDCLIKFPVLIEPEIPDAEKLARNIAQVYISSSDYIKKSWGETNSLCVSIDLPYHMNQDIDWKNNKKVLIDPILPKDFIKQIPDNIKPLLTTNPHDAYCYLHMWRTVTSTMVDCLANSLPVLLYQNKYLDHLSGCCLKIDSLNDISEDLKSQIEEKNLVKESKDWVVDNCFKISEFKKKWSHVINFMSLQYFKGI